MKVSTRGDYAARALLSLSLHDCDGPTSVRDIAERTGLPQPYLEQILLALKGAGLVRSKRGVGGGYVLARSPSEIALSDILSAVDGPIVAGDFGEFYRQFEWMGIQRLLKVLGIFARLNHRDAKPAYLADMPRVLGHLRPMLRRYSEFGFIERLLAQRLGDQTAVGYTF